MTNREAYMCFKMRIPVRLKMRDDFFEREYKIIAFTESISREGSLVNKINRTNRYKYTFMVADESGAVYYAVASNLTAIKPIDETAVFFPVFEFAEQ